jgi:hypothetical protein
VSAGVMSPTGAEPSSPSCLAAARAVRRRARPEVREWRVEHVQERPALPQTSCDQQRKHRHAEQEPRSQLAEVRAPSPSMTPPIAGRTVPRCEAAASFAAYTNASISRSARRSSAPNSLPGRHDERAEHRLRALRRREPRIAAGRNAACSLRADITVALLVGTSAGALNAASVASRPQTVATACELGRI